jgi:hypothetical protein
MNSFRLGRCAAFAALGFLTIAVAGCGGSSRASVEGTVTYDGTPVDTGGIVFVPESSGADSKKATAVIKDGKYAMTGDSGPVPGKYKVEITWNKSTGAKGASKDPDMQNPKLDTKQALPDKYNKATTLTADVKSGSQKIDFTLAK